MAGIKSEKNLLSKILMAAGIIWFVFLMLFIVKADAAEISFDFTSTDGSDGYNIRDNNNYTMEPFEAGTTLTLSSSESIAYVYIKWDKAPGNWTLKAGSTDIQCGASGFVQELVSLTTPASSVSIVIPEGGATIVDVYAYGSGELPSSVHAWKEPYEQADILLFATHSDDDTLFFGGLIPNYTNREDVAVQVAYFTEHYTTGEDYRIQEMLNGLWTMGVDHYPQMGVFEDLYSESYDQAAGQYNYDNAVAYCVSTIRKFKAQVVVGQDIINGEYGHGAHIFFAKALADAVELTNDGNQYTDSVSAYGTWEVKKLYFHAYPENVVELDARQPLSRFGGKTALEVAKEAYLCHDSQQWCWFYVDDGYDENGNPNGCEFACTKYGLYKTTVGADTTMKDVLDNITPYSVINAPEVTTSEETTDGSTETTTTKAAGAETPKKSGGNTVVIIVVIVVVIAILIVLALIIRNNKRRKALAMKRRRQQQKRLHDERFRNSGSGYEGQERRRNDDRQNGARYSNSSRNKSDRYR